MTVFSAPLADGLPDRLPKASSPASTWVVTTTSNLAQSGGGSSKERGLLPQTPGWSPRSLSGFLEGGEMGARIPPLLGRVA